MKLSEVSKIKKGAALKLKGGRQVFLRSVKLDGNKSKVVVTEKKGSTKTESVSYLKVDSVA